ncbi:MAG: SUMF1/EgtB/PvdO family nonheme iron enzyme [Myxococcota bacterium]|nr:SUMF1/EgtB/PvdO family nonheme iron enzyme [Myxococcota bacterium]
MLNRLSHYSSCGFLAVSLCLVAACTDEPLTSLVVLVDTDMDIPNDLDEIHINGVNAKGVRSRVIEFKLRAKTESSESYTLPLSFEVQPQSPESLKGEFELYITARRDGKDLFERSVRTQYVEGKRKLLPIFLAHRCVGESGICEDEAPKQTCGQEGCESPVVNASQLDDYDPESGSPSFSFPQSAPPPTPGVEITITATVAYQDSKGISCSFSGVTALNEAPVTYHARWMGPEPYDDPEFTNNVVPGDMILFPDDTFTKRKRETWFCEVKSIANDVEQLSRQSILIVNSEPNFAPNTSSPQPSVQVQSNNSSLNQSTEFTCLVSGLVTDPDQDNWTILYDWHFEMPDGSSFVYRVESPVNSYSNNTLSGNNPEVQQYIYAGVHLSCAATPKDDEGAVGSSLRSEYITLLDNPVTIRSIQAPTYVFTSTGPGQSSQVNCEVEYRDPDIGQIVEGQISWTRYGQFLNERIQSDSMTSTSAATPQTFSSTLDTLGQPPGSYKCFATFTSTNSVAGGSPILDARTSSYKYTHLINYGPRNDIADRSLVAFFPFDSEFESASEVKEFIRSESMDTEPCSNSGSASAFLDRHIVGGQIDSAKEMNACPHKLVTTQSPFDDLSEVTICGWVSVSETYDLSTSDVEGLISVYSSTVSPPKMTDLRGFEFGLTGSQSSSTLIQPYFSLQTSPVGFALGQTRSYVRRSLDSTHGTARTGFFPPSSSAALEDRWTHLCARYDGYTISAWMDGFKIIEEDFRGGILGFENQYIATSTISEMGRRNGRTFLLVGAGWGSTDPFRGAMDNFKVWNRALSPTEICDDSGSELCVQWVWSEPAQVFFSRNEITVGQFQNWVNTCDPNDSNFVCSQPTQYRTYTELADCNFGRISSSGSPPADRLAMNCVNSDEAYNFCKRQDDGADVLFQEEWRLEARASNGSATQTYPWGNQAPSCDYAIMSDPNGGTFPGCVNDPADSHPGEVCSGSRPLSHSGLCNMGGNVSEWFHDAATASYGTIGGAYTSFAPSDFLSTQSSLTLLTDDREPEQGIRCMKVPKGRIYSTNPARSCRQIFSQRPDAPHGNYEIKFQNNTTLLPRPNSLAHCQMGRYGGMTWLLNSTGDGHLMQNEVTVGEYQRCVDDGECHIASSAQLAYSDNPQCNFGDPARDKHPMNCLTTDAAEEFCEWAAPGSPNSDPGRLPSAMELEREITNYDSIGFESTSHYPWGDDAGSCSNAWLTALEGSLACARSAVAPATIQTCSLPAGYNQNHFCDLIGNVAEFTAEEPPLPDHYVAGRSFKDAFNFLESGYYSTPLDPLGDLQPPNTPSIGFRCARTGPLWD